MTRLQRTKEGRNIPVYYYGERFESVRDLASYLELTINQIKWALTDRYQGELFEKEVSHILESNFVGNKCYFVFNRPFFSFGEMAHALGLRENVLQMIYFRVKERNLFEEEVIKRLNSEPIFFNGVEYESLSVLCSKHKVDYPTFIRRLRVEHKTIEEALLTPVNTSKGIQRNFKGVDYISVRELYNAHNYSRSIDGRFKNAYPQFDSIEVFDWYLDFLKENELEPSEEMITTIPMVYYNGSYYNRAIAFYEEVGITSRNVGHEKNAKENVGLELEEIVSKMSIRINQHTGERQFPNCTIDPESKLFFVKNRFDDYMKSKINQLTT